MVRRRVGMSRSSAHAAKYACDVSQMRDEMYTAKPGCACSFIPGA